ncbi:hypothetical protein EIP86_009731 [Pleurotus ostreatoroseus]|nr:hypothetical protein EIP86_009731 [Pleurotus ostreatoroseus]
MSAALCAWKSGQPVPENRTEPAWNNALTFAAIGFISASLGLQAIMAMRVKSQMGTTILVTVFWCDLAADPKLFKLKNPARDRKLFAMAALFLGGFVARVILQKTGAPSALGVGTGIRFLMAIGWLFAPASKTSKP